MSTRKFHSLRAVFGGSCKRRVYLSFVVRQLRQPYRLYKFKFEKSKEKYLTKFRASYIIAICKAKLLYAT